MAKRPGEKVALEIETGKSNVKTNLEKVKNAGFDRIILFATSPAAVAACQRAVESIKRGQSPSIDMLNWLDIS